MWRRTVSGGSPPCGCEGRGSERWEGMVLKAKRQQWVRLGGKHHGLGGGWEQLVATMGTDSGGSNWCRSQGVCALAAGWLWDSHPGCHAAARSTRNVGAAYPLYSCAAGGLPEAGHCWPSLQARRGVHPVEPWMLNNLCTPRLSIRSPWPPLQS